MLSAFRMAASRKLIHPAVVELVLVMVTDAHAAAMAGVLAAMVVATALPMGTKNGRELYGTSIS